MISANIRRMEIDISVEIKAARIHLCRFCSDDHADEIKNWCFDVDSDRMPCGTVSADYVAKIGTDRIENYQFDSGMENNNCGRLANRVYEMPLIENP